MTDPNQKSDQNKPDNKPPAIPETTYPAGMEKERKLPESGNAKPGPRNPPPLDE